MKCPFLASLCLIGLLPSIVHADHEIQIRLSIKVIRNRDMSPPQEWANISSSIDIINDRFEQNGRGYRFVLVDPITMIGGGFDTTRPNPSHYFFSNIVLQPDERLNMEADAQANPQLWAWNFNAVNLYIHDPTSGVECVHPESDLIVIGDDDAWRFNLVLHELGHYFGLCNTQGCDCTCGDCGSPGSDGIADTLPDMPGWDEEDSAQFNFGTSYDSLTPAQQDQVDAVIRSAMSYRGTSTTLCGTGFPAGGLTEGQLDRWADTASTSRSGACDGRTYFVQAGAGGIQTGRSTAPYDRVIEGVTAAQGGGDIVMIRGGTYPERLTISTPVTLRTPRAHVARIGG